MNKFIDWLIASLKYITKKNKLYIIAFYNKTRFLINKNFTLSKIYKPIIEEKVNINKNLKQSLRDIDNKNKEVEKNILNLQNENALLQNKISIIQNLLTKRHD
jgi:hypothetical protein